ncbi:hypothetical protein [Cellulomonas phragmiteti]|uniref:Uncharacterized protein n=1 Tax=Cellulomonas phragmiteti TaxID=478780 RepID=A0ABQ4DNI5_9CELL|nr:hypothetical protein [Cellulomonas phragmiteti]GIG40910.1 hypothetical protein Cph01nite_26720 [Cellulomonas phragmiteti]
MTDDLATRLRATRDAYEEREAETRPDEVELARLYRDVRRHRAARHLRSVGAVAAAGVAVATIGWFGLNVAPDVPPAQTPSPSPTVTATPTPDAAPGPTAPEVVRAPVVITGMPPMWELDDATLAAVGPGWTLVTYGPQDQGGADVPAQVVLASPGGDLFHVAQEPAGRLDVLAWDGGPTAVVAGPDGRASLDLRTGALAADPRGLPSGAHAYGPHAAGELWSASDGTTWVVPASGDARAVPGTAGLRLDLAPDGARGAAVDLDGRPVVVDLRTGARTDVGVAGLRCSVLGWADAARVGLLCTDPTDADDGGFLPYLLADPGSRPRYVLVAADGSGSPEVREIRTGELVPGRVLPVRPGTVALAGAPLGDDVIECATSTELRTGDTVSSLVAPGDARLPHTTVIGVVGDVVHVLRFVSCAPDGDAGPSETVVVDTVTGTTTVLPAGPVGDSTMVPGRAVTVTG